MRLLVIPLIGLCALTSCAGGGQRTGLPPSAPASDAHTATVQFRIVVPARTSARARSPLYVSASTRSASIAVAPSGGNAGTPVVVDCTTVCAGQVAAPVGSDTFAVDLYDQPGGAGKLLSTGSLTQTIVADQANVVNVTFNGVVAAVSVTLVPSSVPAGAAATIAVNLMVKDADGNTIVGPGSYVNAQGQPVTVTLSDSDTSGATKLSATTFTAPPAAAITLSYNGASIASPRITAAFTGGTSANATLTIAVGETLYASAILASSNEIAELLVSAGGGGTPEGTISGANTQLSNVPGVAGIAFDAHEQLYVATWTTTDASATLAPQYVYVYPAGANGNAAPVREFGDASLTANPVTVAFDTNGDPTVVYQGLFGGPYVVDVFAPNASGLTSPLGQISGAATQLNGPWGSAYDAGGNLEVSNTAGSTITVYPAGHFGNVAPSRTIATDLTRAIDMPTATAVDPAGNLYVANAAGVTAYAPSTSGYAAPIRTIAGSSATLLGTDAAGNVYSLMVSQPGSATAATVTEYAALPSTSATPIATIPIDQSSTNGFVESFAVGHDGSLYVQFGTSSSPQVEIFDPGNVSGSPNVTLTTTLSNNCSVAIGVDTDSTLYVGCIGDATLGGTSSVVVYPPHPTAATLPSRTFTITDPFASASSTGSIVGLAFDALHQVYVEDANGLLGSSQVAVSAYPANATGSPAARTMTMPIVDAKGLAIDGAREIVYIASDFEPFEVLGYPAGSSGTPAATLDIRSGAGGVFEPTWMAKDGTGDIYVLCTGDGSVRVYDPTGTTLVRSILGLPAIGDLAVDANGTVFALEGSGYQLYQFPPSGVLGHGRHAAARRPNGRRAPRDVVTDAAGTILVYAPGASGDTPPSAVIQASTTGLTSSSGLSPVFGLAIGPAPGPAATSVRRGPAR